MSALPCQVADWKPRTAGTLRGFFTVIPPSGLVLHELMLHHRDGTWWLSFPSKPMLSPEGTVLREPDGKVRYGAPLISFASRSARERFTEQVLAALREALPDVFAAESVA
jgi:hypothetical protein